MDNKDFIPSNITIPSEVPAIPEGIIDPSADIVVNIDTDEISTGAVDEADSMFEELRAMYFDEEFMKAHPVLAKRIRQETYALYVLLKMRKSDEIIHDLNVKSIASNPSNASLYRSLKDIQSSILAIQTKIDDKVKDITSILKEKQLELNYADSTDNEGNQVDPITNNSYRGSKSFIESIQAEQEAESEESH